MKSENPTMPFIINQLEEALEERQKPDRRKSKYGEISQVEHDRRKGDRRERAAQQSAAGTSP